MVLSPEECPLLLLVSGVAEQIVLRQSLQLSQGQGEFEQGVHASGQGRSPGVIVKVQC